MVLLGFLLASAQAFHIPAQTRTGLSSNSKPSFFGQAVAQRPPAARSTLVASLEDIERKVIEAEKAKAATAQGARATERKAEAAPKAAPAPAPAPAPKQTKAPVKTVAPAPAPVVGKREREGWWPEEVLHWSCWYGIISVRARSALHTNTLVGRSIAPHSHCTGGAADLDGTDAGINSATGTAVVYMEHAGREESKERRGGCMVIG